MMKTEALHIGMEVEHPHYGVGVVKGLSEKVAEILFQEGMRSVSPEGCHLQPADPVATLSDREISLWQFIEQTVRALVTEMGLEKPESVVDSSGGVGPRQVFDIGMDSADLTPRNGPIMHFSKARGPL
jgi:hypothetical protein